MSWGLALDDTDVALASVRRTRRRWLPWVATIAALAAVAAGISCYLYLSNVYMPLQQIGGAPDTSASSLFLRSEAISGAGQTGAFGPTYVYCSVPNHRFAVSMTLTNTGLLPVSILGADPGPGAPTTTDGDSFFLVDLASHRQPLDDPLTAPALPPTSIDHGQSLDVWARYQTMDKALPDGSAALRSTAWVRYSVLGIVRTAEVQLFDSVEIQGGDCPPADTTQPPTIS
jgi:hypothetical protein